MKKLLFGGVCVTILATASFASAEEVSDTNNVGAKDEIIVIGKRANRISKGATGLALDIKDTPQSISIISKQQMQDFGTKNINDALRLGTGINVEEWETNRTNYMARGFDIVNTQIDGTGMPNNWGILVGALDSYGYDKIEVIRGANGLLTGVGNSSGTINFVRKRPLNEDQGEINISGGSYDFKRIELDYNKVLDKDGRWAARIVAAHEDKDSYLRGYSSDRTFLYGVIDGQIGDNGTITVGYSYQNAHSNGVMWGALNFDYSDGTQAVWDTSASTTQDWTYWDTVNQTAFIEYTHRLSENWEAKLTYNYRHSDEDAKLFYAYTYSGLNSDNTGLIGWPGWWPTVTKNNMFDASLSGKFKLFGREHQLLAGVNYSKGVVNSYWHPVLSTSSSYTLPAFPYAGNVFAEPTWDTKQLYSIENNERTRIYLATKLNISDKLNAIIGLNSIDLQRDGGSRYGSSTADFTQKESKVSPYAGLTYDFTNNILGYVSYSDIYQNQDQNDINGHFLPAMKGVNYEAGVKAEWFNKRLLTTFAYFEAEQKGLATYAGVTEDFEYYYVGVDVKSKGVEFEATGKLSENTNVVFGITNLELTGNDGNDIYEWVPRTTVNLLFDSRLPKNPKLKYGIGGKWQSEISTYATAAKIKQDAYLLLNAFASYDLTDTTNLKINIGNLTDKKYITSLYQVGYYGSPRNVTVSFGYKF